MSVNQDKLVNWAVDTLRETPDPALPEGFLARFEANLAQEPTPLLPVQTLPRSTPHWSRTLMAAVLMVAALAAFFWLNPRETNGQGTGLLLVSTADSAGGTVRELAPSDSLETGAVGGLTLMAGGPGNEIRLGPESRLSVAKSWESSSGHTVAELALERGSVFVTETQAKVSVRTAHALIQPIGTDYQVKRSSEQTSVTVLEGMVAVRLPGVAQSVAVKSGQKLVVNKGAKYGDLRPVSLSQEQIEPLRTRQESRPKVMVKPRVGEKLNSYPKAKPRVPQVAQQPRQRPRQQRQRVQQQRPRQQRQRVQQQRPRQQRQRVQQQRPRQQRQRVQQQRPGQQRQKVPQQRPRQQRPGQQQRQRVQQRRYPSAPRTNPAGSQTRATPRTNLRRPANTRTPLRRPGVNQRRGSDTRRQPGSWSGRRSGNGTSARPGNWRQRQRGASGGVNRTRATRRTTGRHR